MDEAERLADRVATIARRNIIKIKRVPDLFVFTALSPIMFVPFEIRRYQKVVSR